MSNINKTSAMIPPRQTIKYRVIILYSILISINIIAWMLAWNSFHENPVLIALCFLVYGFGLRHAVDADHIAAIDNVTRRLMQSGQRPVTVGFWFAVGHSTIVALGTWAVINVSSQLSFLNDFKATGAKISTIVSMCFLLAIATMNISIFRSTWHAYKKFRSENQIGDRNIDQLIASSGFMTRLFRPLFSRISRSHYMALLGLLFGLGFDTATEIALVGISAQQAAQGVALQEIMILPLLFAAGMSLIDSTDGVLMLGVYQWAFVKPLRKIYYNMTITLVSVVIAVLIALLEACALLGNAFALQGEFWKTTTAITDNFNTLGFIIIGVFIGAWGIAWALYHIRGLDKLGVAFKP